NPRPALLAGIMPPHHELTTFAPLPLMTLLERCHEVAHLPLSVFGQESKSSKKSCRSIVNLRAFINASPYHFPFRFVTTVSSIESRDGDVLVCPAGVTPTAECTTASWGLRNFTNFTSPSRRDPFETVSKTRSVNVAICCRSFR